MLGPGVQGTVPLVLRASTVTTESRTRIEIIGSPGSGKSVLFTPLLEKLGAVDRRDLLVEALREASVDRAIKRVVQLLPQRITRPRGYELFYRSRDYPRSYFQFAASRTEFHSLATQLSLDETESAARPWRLYQKHAVVSSSYEFLARSGVLPSRPMLLDEEFIQNLVLDLANTRRSELVELADKYLALCPLPDCVVVARAPVELCKTRVHERGKVGAWPVTIDSKKGPDFLRRVGEVLPVVIDSLDRSGVPVVEVCTGGGEPPGRLAASAVRRIESAL